MRCPSRPVSELMNVSFLEGAPAPRTGAWKEVSRPTLKMFVNFFFPFFYYVHHNKFSECIKYMNKYMYIGDINSIV